MGARPIALLDGLWFAGGSHDFDRAVAGIGHYGNCVGVANVGGETVFDEAYRGNCLVNAMCVGLLDAARLQSAKAQGPGNVVVLYGATTGRDGIGGASVLASQELGEDDSDKRPSVQVGDPFTRQEAHRGVGGARRVAGSSSRCRTAAPPASRPRSPRWRATAPASTSTSTACRCARQAWSPGRS